MSEDEKKTEAPESSAEDVLLSGKIGKRVLDASRQVVSANLGTDILELQVMFIARIKTPDNNVVLAMNRPVLIGTLMKPGKPDNEFLISPIGQ